MNLNLVLWSAPDWTSTWLRCHRKDKKTATTTQQELAQGDLRLKQDLSKHQCRCHLLWELKYLQQAWMDWRRTRKAWSVFVRRCEEIEQIASTRSFSPSRRRWSDWIQNFGTNVCLTVRAFAPLVNWTMVESFAKRRRSWKESPALLESELIRDNPLPSSNSWTFRRKSGWSCIARQRDVTQRFSSSTSTTLEVHHDLHSIIQSRLIAGGKDVKRERP